MSQSGPNQHFKCFRPCWTFLHTYGPLWNTFGKVGKKLFSEVEDDDDDDDDGGLGHMCPNPWDTCVPTLGTHVSQPPIIIISGMCPNPADDQLPMAENS